MSINPDLYAALREIEDASARLLDVLESNERTEREARAELNRTLDLALLARADEEHGK